MKYRAVLTGVPDLERPLQQFSESLEVLESWGQAVVGEHRDNPRVRVLIYEVRAVLVREICGPG